MTTPAIITVAITGAVPTTRDNPALPVVPERQVISAIEAYEAGATVCHVHVRDADERPASDPALYDEVRRGIQEACPEMIVQPSTGARGRTIEERFACLELRPEMASFSTGSVNFPTGIYENPPDLVEDVAQRLIDLNIKPEIEVFDLAMLYKAADLLQLGLLTPPPHVQLVMGIKNALPPRESRWLTSSPPRSRTSCLRRRGRRWPPAGTSWRPTAGRWRARWPRPDRAGGQHLLQQGPARGVQR